MTEAEKKILSACGLFQGIAPQETEQLLKCLSAREILFSRNDVIWRIGDSIQACAVVLSGAVRAEAVTDSGERALMAFHRPGALVGDVLMATPGGRSPVYVTAAEDTVLIFLPYRQIMDGCAACCPRHSRLRENLVSEIAVKFWAQRQRAGYLSARSLRQRIAMRLWDEHLSTGGLTLSLGGTREDLADFLNVNRSALSRELSRMKQEGILDYYRDTFRILSPERLAGLAGQRAEKPERDV